MWFKYVGTAREDELNLQPVIVGYKIQVDEEGKELQEAHPVEVKEIWGVEFPRGEWVEVKSKKLVDKIKGILKTAEDLGTDCPFEASEEKPGMEAKPVEVKEAPVPKRRGRPPKSSYGEVQA